jgi:hypothetical protein
MRTCNECGKKPEKKDVFCRKCGAKLDEKKAVETLVGSTLVDLRNLVDEAAREIKKELIGQVNEIEEGVKTGRLTLEEFDSKADELKARLINFIKK